MVTDLTTMFPDFHQEVVELTATGDVVVVRTKVAGTYKGVGKLPVEGGMFVGVQPTGSHFKVQHIHWLRYRSVVSLGLYLVVFRNPCGG